MTLSGKDGDVYVGERKVASKAEWALKPEGQHGTFGIDLAKGVDYTIFGTVSRTYVITMTWPAVWWARWRAGRRGRSQFRRRRHGRA